ncbi:hypothetical protein [Campylobacter concisus]|uniref:hypothetical protein n=1 Tax=Campylobacter concisus TaxID=199 RepID=UPI001CA53331|nr:hypothetical protein [Campylobacter concisus]
MPKISSCRRFIATIALLAASAILPTFAHTSPTKGQNQIILKKMIKNIVLVHGTFVNGSCYAELIRHLQEAGINAVAVQNPLNSLAADARLLSSGQEPTSWALLGQRADH